MNISEAESTDILRLVAGILHIGNIQFTEKGNYSQVSDKECKLQKINIELTNYMFYLI